MKTGIAVASAVIFLLIIGGVVFHKEWLDFLDRMPSDRREAAIYFGKALDAAGKDVLNPTTTFTLGENVAWVVRFKKNIGVKELVVALFEIMSDGREIPLDRNKMTVEPTDVGLYNFTTTQAFWFLSPKGMKIGRRTYRVKYLKDHVLAQGDFTIVADSQDVLPRDQPSKPPHVP
ncbi:MAG: hypothetical protein HY204_04080 [Nitrospirae bacterium]|nr:hypothetical protein [Nitrospirota bacterium]